MSTPILTPEEIDRLRETFRRELHEAVSDRDIQAVRDRYLAR
jgi:hypothetical protein